MNTNWKNYRPSINELISLRQASRKCGLSSNHLRLLVGKEIIWGLKIDTVWVTTEKAIEAYIAQERKTGPKAKNT